MHGREPRQGANPIWFWSRRLNNSLHWTVGMAVLLSVSCIGPYTPHSETTVRDIDIDLREVELSARGAPGLYIKSARYAVRWQPPVPTFPTLLIPDFIDGGREPISIPIFDTFGTLSAFRSALFGRGNESDAQEIEIEWGHALSDILSKADSSEEALVALREYRLLEGRLLFGDGLEERKTQLQEQMEALKSQFEERELLLEVLSKKQDIEEKIDADPQK